jgi:hypothetical protein
MLVLGSTGATDATFVFPTLLKVYTGLNIKIAIYPASPEVMLAIERKEVDGRAGSYNSLKPFIDRGLVRPLVRGRVSQPGVENLAVDEKWEHPLWRCIRREILLAGPISLLPGHQLM